MHVKMEIEKDLPDKAPQISGCVTVSELVEETLELFFQRDASRRLADFGGSDLDAKAPRRHRFGPED